MTYWSLTASVSCCIVGPLEVWKCHVLLGTHCHPSPIMLSLECSSSVLPILFDSMLEATDNHQVYHWLPIVSCNPSNPLPGMTMTLLMKWHASTLDKYFKCHLIQKMLVFLDIIYIHWQYLRYGYPINIYILIIKCPGDLMETLSFPTRGLGTSDISKLWRAAFIAKYLT